MKFFYFIILFLFSLNCYADRILKVSDFLTPGGYKRVLFEKDSYSHWIQNLPIKKKNDIKLYTGETLPTGYYNVFAVIDKSLLFKRDLEQCADFAMRFWGDYHLQKKKENKMYLYNYSGKKIYFRNKRLDYRKFLENVMIKSNSYSIKKGAKQINENDLVPGDMIVQNERGGIGHVSIIMDICINKLNERLYLIGYSYMPAQEFHIEKSTGEYGKEGWFTLQGYFKYLQKNMPLGKPFLRRF